MRDTLKDKIYFEEVRKSTEFMLESFFADFGEDPYGELKNHASSVNMYLMDKAILAYTTGDSIEKVKDILDKCLVFFEIDWFDYDEKSKYFGYDFYWDLVTILSLSYVLDLNREKVFKIIKKRKMVKTADFLLDNLCDALEGKALKNTDKIMETNPYKSLLNVFNAPTKDEATKLLYKYLKSNWYRKNQAMSWYGSHNKNTYVGYWSFESVAIVKMLGLDDSSFKDLRYYPYDLLHNAE